MDIRKTEDSIFYDQRKFYQPSQILEGFWTMMNVVVFSWQYALDWFKNSLCYTLSMPLHMSNVQLVASCFTLRSERSQGNVSWCLITILNKI